MSIKEQFVKYIKTPKNIRNIFICSLLLSRQVKDTKTAARKTRSYTIKTCVQVHFDNTNEHTEHELTLTLRHTLLISSYLTNITTFNAHQTTLRNLITSFI